jgi:hypothetical protein
VIFGMLRRKVARDALCDTAGKMFRQNRDVAAAMTVDLALCLVRLQENGGEPFRLKELVAAVNIGTRLASLADRPPLLARIVGSTRSVLSPIGASHAISTDE